jgi:hypothetical protein
VAALPGLFCTSRFSLLMNGELMAFTLWQFGRSIGARQNRGLWQQCYRQPVGFT